MECIVFGTGTAFLSDILAIFHRLSWTAVGFVAGGEEGVPLPSGVDPIEPHNVPDEWLNLPATIPLLTPWRRRDLERLARDVGFTRFPAIVDPTAVIAHDSSVAEGVLINAGVVIGANTHLGRFATVNRACSIGHDGRIGEYSFLGPGVTVCGRVTVGGGSVVGSGAVLTPAVTVGSGSVVGVGSVVFKAVPDGCLVLGNPAKIVRSGLEERDVKA